MNMLMPDSADIIFVYAICRYVRNYVDRREDVWYAEFSEMATIII